MSSVSTKPRLFLYLAITVLVVLNCAFLLRDYQKEQDRRDLLQRLYRTQVEVRVLKSEKMFGAPFVPEFRTVDLEGEPAAMPNFGKGQLLILFFQPSHCGSCLKAMSSFEAVIGDNVPVIGVVQAKLPEEIMPTLDVHEYEFPVYLAVDSPFDLSTSSPYSVLINESGIVVHLSAIDPNIQSVEELISQLAQLLERR
ncbi:MAG: redoxin domain-containing protein [candidate division Zixibacteria bacterium]|nr:redoxin domain-containing protein [candidate division Zixibacteria bacterium]